MEEVNKQYQEGLKRKLEELIKVKEEGKKTVVKEIEKDDISNAQDYLNEIRALEIVIYKLESLLEGEKKLMNLKVGDMIRYINKTTERISNEIITNSEILESIVNSIEKDYIEILEHKRGYYEEGQVMTEEEKETIKYFRNVSK